MGYIVQLAEIKNMNKYQLEKPAFICYYIITKLRGKLCLLQKGEVFIRS